MFRPGGSKKRKPKGVALKVYQPKAGNRTQATRRQPQRLTLAPTTIQARSAQRVVQNGRLLKKEPLSLRKRLFRV